MRIFMRVFFVVTASAVLVLSIASPALAESAPLEIVSCVAAPDSIALPQEAAISVSVSDNQNVERIHCSLTCRYLVEIASGPMDFDPENGLWTASLSLPEYLSEGYYCLSIAAYDGAGDLVAKDYEDILYVRNEHADAVMPEFVSGRLGTPKTKVPADVSVSAEATDDHGVAYFYCDAYKTPGEEYGMTTLEYNPDTETWEGTLSLPAAMPPGEYMIAFFIYDGACNATAGEFSQPLYVTGVDESAL